MEVSHYYDEFEGWGGGELDEQERNMVIKTISLIPNDVDSVIDVGCGDGRVTNRLTRFKKVVGLDFSKAALKYVKSEK